MFDVFNPVAFQIHGGGHGGVASLLGDFLAFIESLLHLPASEVFAAVMPGIAAMNNIHPMFVHFPIAFLLTFFILDVIASVANKDEWRNVAGWLLYLGAATGIVTVATGLYAAAIVPHGENVHDIMEHHEQFGLAVLSLAFVLSLWRWLGGRFLRGGVNVLYLGVAAIMVICMSVGADFGGLMVYHYGVNVGVAEVPTTFDFEHNHDEHHDHDHEHSD